MCDRCGKEFDCYGYSAKTDEGGAEVGTSDLLERSSILAAIDAEPEYPGEPPFEMRVTLEYAIEKKDVDLIFEAMRLTVKLTKQGIRERVCAL